MAHARKSLIIITALLPVLAHASQAPFRVVIDPGHGGTDNGTIYDNGSRQVAEKDITLLLARETARQLRARGIHVMLTRNGDQEVTLPRRTQLANKFGADVFVSIHMNSTSTPMVSDAQGIETYILNNATNASSRRLARLENQVLSEDVAEKTDVALILKDLRLDANLSESKRLACAVQSHLVSATRQENRGVRQALFHVLLGADMPSILVEAGFLTSPRDRQLVLSPHGRRSISSAIAKAVEQYRRTKDSSQAISALSRCKVH